MEVTVNKLDESEPHQLYHRYPGQTNPQGCYIELDTRTGEWTADYNAEIGNAVPMDVWHSRTLRFRLGAVPNAAHANRLLEELAPLAQRILDGASVEWDGSNLVGRFTADAQAAENEIDEILDSIEWQYEEPCERLDGEWFWDAMHQEVTGAMTDEEIEAMVDATIDNTRDEAPNAVIDRDSIVGMYRDRRDELKEEEA